MPASKVVKVNQNPADASHEIFEAIHTVMHLFRSEQYRAFRDDPLPLTHMEGKLLGYFARHPDSTLSDLVAHSGRDKGQLAKLIKTLKGQGLLEASADKTDRRSVRLRLSPKGREIHRELKRQTTRLAKLAVAGLKPDECARLAALLRRVKANLETPST